MLEGLAYKCAAAFGMVDIPGVEAWRFEAVPGTHCKQCPARGECPIPEHLRSWAGEINTEEQAVEAAALLEQEKARHAARQKELRLFAKAHGPIPVGADEELRFEEQTSYKTDWGALEAAVERAAQFGEPFDLEAYRRPSTSNRFVKKKVELAELPEEPELSADERFGTVDDVPF
jgi:hypothetical protein